MYSDANLDVEAQKRIEQEIKRLNIAENLSNAMEYNPESFGRVVMLYIPVKVNGVAIKAFVDSGAQATIISPALASKCGLRLSAKIAIRSPLPYIAQSKSSFLFLEAFRLLIFDSNSSL